MSLFVPGTRVLYLEAMLFGRLTALQAQGGSDPLERGAAFSRSMKHLALDMVKHDPHTPNDHQRIEKVLFTEPAARGRSVDNIQQESWIQELATRVSFQVSSVRDVPFPQRVKCVRIVTC